MGEVGGIQVGGGGVGVDVNEEVICFFGGVGVDVNEEVMFL